MAKACYSSTITEEDIKCTTLYVLGLRYGYAGFALHGGAR